MFSVRLIGGDMYIRTDLFGGEEFFPAAINYWEIDTNGVIEEWDFFDVKFEREELVESTITVTNFIPSEESFAFDREFVNDRKIRVISIPSGEYFYVPEFQTRKSFPLSINLPGQNGEFSGTNISPYQRYYSMPTLSQDLVRRARSSSVISSYIPSEDAMFLGTYYTGFYISNPSEIDVTFSGIFLSITGGTQYTISNNGNEMRVVEAEPFIEDENPLLGTTRTSMFGQVRISLLRSDDGNMVSFNRDGTSPYIDLRSQVFSPANQRLHIPDLSPGEHFGVYVKVETAFSPMRVYSKDYSFLNLSYISNYPSGQRVRSSYPGQSETLSGTRLGQLLPSIYFEFSTGYDSVVKEIESSTDKLYNRYPPYFLHYEDL